jgi:hypothetical protein
MELLDKYAKELEEDTEINRMILCDVQMKLPAIKHKWVARLINHKVEVDEVKSLIIQAKETIIEKQLSNTKVKMSRPSLEKNAESHETVIKLRNRVREVGFVIMYLEKVEKILSNMSFDIKNLTEIMKQELL